MTDEVKKIINDLRICNNNDSSQCRRCSRLKDDISCFMKLGFDAADLIEHMSVEQDALVLEIERLRKELEAAKSAWISVEDRLPESIVRNHVSRIIVCVDKERGYKRICEGLYLHGAKVFITKEKGQVTHWQPLPEPPKEV